jgi:hypothetical protein
MAKKQLTPFQKLDKILGPEGVKVPRHQANRYTINNDEILKTTDKAEFERAKLQAQQNKFLSHQWRRVDGEMYQQSIHYETTRIASYSDFENMEFYPEIAAALDIVSEESCTNNDKGKVINIYSNSARVKAILEDLFINRLDIHTSLPMWTRNTIKYGDNFVLLNLDDTQGIVGCRQMPNFEMERSEGTLYNALSTRNIMNSTNTPKADEDSKVKFYWKGKNVEFNAWQMVHFRLLGDDRKLPYGTSMLEKARRIWKQLLLAEDAMLVYRLTRAPERRVYKIFVGNIDDADVPAYVNDVANKFKRSMKVDPQTGQIDLKYNQWGQDQDIFIPVRDESAPTPIDVLPGASNLNDIMDIEFLQKKLFAALRVPKEFIGFTDPSGDGKNLALKDIRFSRMVNRVQQSMIRGLNEAAIIHLYLLGFEDDINNFTISLNNPSTQAEMLKIEHLQQKITAYKDAVSDAGNGFGAMSMTRAKREILGMSDDEIKQDMLEQRIETAAAVELEKTSEIIKRTGFFDTVDGIYGVPGAEYTDAEGNKPGSDAGGGGGGGFGGGGGLGSDLDFGSEEETEDTGDTGGEGLGGLGDDTGEPDLGNDTGGLDLTPETPAEPEAPKTEESYIKKTEKIITEQKNIINNKLIARKEKYNNMYFNRLIESVNRKDNEIQEKTKIYDSNLKINENVQSMIQDLDKLLKPDSFKE